MSFVRALLHTPSPSTPLSRFNTLCGFFYLGVGLLNYFWPANLQATLHTAAFAGREEGLMRLTGFSLAVIGYFYIFGSRTRSESFGLATVVDRLLVPAFLLPLGLSGAVEPVLAYAFSILDPVLGVIALLIWRRTRDRR